MLIGEGTNFFALFKISLIIELINIKKKKELIRKWGKIII